MMTFGRLLQVGLLFLLIACSDGSEGGASISPWSGIKQLGVASQASGATGVALDTSGNVYLSGDTTGGLNRNTQTGTFDYFVAKYSATGALTWLKQLGVALQSSSAAGVAVDISGNVYTAGYTTGGLNGNIQTGAQDYFIARHGSNGSLIWLKQLGIVAQTSGATGITLDTSGNVYVSGYTTGGLNGNTQKGAQDYFVAKYTSNGALTWLKQLGVASQISSANGVAVDTSGNVYVAGSTSGGLNANSQTGTQDHFVARYASNGTLIWLKQSGVTAKVAYGFGVAVDTLGNIYTSGYTTGGLAGNTQTGVQDYFVAKYANNGALTWLNQLGVTSQYSDCRAVTVDTSGSVYAAGYTSGGLSSNIQKGLLDYFVAKYNSNGTLTWLNQLGVASQTSEALGVAVDVPRNVYIAGYTTGGLDGNTEVGSQDYFVAKYSPSGALQ